MAGDEDTDGDGDGSGAASEWRFAVDEVGEASEGAGVAGSWAPTDVIEPGEIDPENALFVALGIVLGIVLIAVLIP